MIVGNCPELGAWSVPDTTVKLCWGEGHVWFTPKPCTLESPPDPIQFKVPSAECALSILAAAMLTCSGTCMPANQPLTGRMLNN